MGIFCLCSHRNVFYFKKKKIYCRPACQFCDLYGLGCEETSKLSTTIKSSIKKSSLYWEKKKTLQLCFCTSLQGLGWEVAFFEYLRLPRNFSKILSGTKRVQISTSASQLQRGVKTTLSQNLLHMLKLFLEWLCFLLTKYTLIFK